MDTCNECKREFPDNCVSLMFTTRGSTTCCAICALKIRNEMHGMNDKRFQGEMANVALDNCKRYLKSKGKS